VCGESFNRRRGTIGMPDMLVSLVHLPPIEPLLEKLRGEGIFIRRPNPWDATALREFIEKHFSRGWADETSIAFSHQPITAFIATHDEDIIGFGAYECTRRNFFGPTGVAEEWRGRGVGKALLLACLYGLQDMGYVYAIIGAAGPVEYYQKAVGAIVIPLDEGRGIYPLKEDPRFLSK
jgi:predicted N-acetyltransferase YhbS